MDDLDHSMHIAEFDWTSFYDESEECCLLQPSLACPDDASLSDSEDSSSVFGAGQQDIQRPSEAAECPAGEEICKKSSVKLIQIGAGGEQAEEVSETEVDSETCLDYPTGNAFSAQGVRMKTGDVTGAKNYNITNTLQTETIHVQCSKELKKEDGDLQAETDHSRREADPLSLNRTEVNMSTTDRAVSEDVSGVRAEKERWFVTVNVTPARQRDRATSVKKKRRQKKPCKNSQTCSHGQKKSHEKGLDLELIKSKNDGRRDTGGFPLSNQNLVHNTGGHQSAELNLKSESDSLQTSCEDDNVPENLVISHSLKENTTELTTDRNTHEPSSSAFTSKDCSEVEGAESDEFEGGAESFSIRRYDSEHYLSAAESVEETQNLLRTVDLRPVQSASADSTRDVQMHFSERTPPCNTAATSCECAGAEPFPHAGQGANKTATATGGSNSTALHALSDASGAQNQKMTLSASGGSSGDGLTPLPVPSLTVSPCSVADSPETSHTRPVYAISAFWDEMEKLTINDILQLRMGRSTTPKDTQETVTASKEESATSNSSPVDTVQYNLFSSCPMDTPDTADSDYFTQTDDSKPDRSSCEFSTSDFEEEYWQFIGTSRNPSPDPDSRNLPGTGDSPFLSHEEEEEEVEEESLSSEGKETPVPTEDFAAQGFEDQESPALSKPAWPRPMAKSKSMHNVQALNKEDLTFFFGDDESGLFPSSCQSLEEDMVLRVTDSLGALTLAPFLSYTDILDENHQISFPKAFEYFSKKDKPKNDSRCVTVYDPKDIAVAPVFDYTLCTIRDEMFFSSLHDSQRSEGKPIPIFTCSNSSIRELAFPRLDYVFLSADREEVDNFSPVRAVSCSLIQASQYGTSAAAAGRVPGWNSLLLMRKIHFHDKGSLQCTRSCAWVFPVEAGRMETKYPPITVLTEGRVSSTASQLFGELAVPQSIVGAMQTTRREGILSTLRQSDMCLLCIAFAAWVLRSSDPEAADAWKAALLANVSALSAIQYLRHVKKNPPQADP